MLRISFFAAATLICSTHAHAVMYLARPYEPNMARWLTRDPIGERGFQVLHLAGAAGQTLAGQSPDSEVLSGPNLYAFVLNSPANLVDGLGFCPCKCQSVKGGPFQDRITQVPGNAPNTISVGVNVPWKVTVEGDITKCHCKYIDNGNIWGQVHFHGGPTLEQNKPFPNVVTDPISCTYPNDRPGFELGVPASGSLSYVIRYQLSVSLVCQDEVGSGSASDTVNIDALFMGGNLRWP